MVSPLTVSDMLDRDTWGVFPQQGGDTGSAVTVAVNLLDSKG